MEQTCDLCSEPVRASMEGGKFCLDHYDEVWEWRHALEAAAIAATGGPIPQTCPRRNDGGAPLVKGPDRWEYGHGLITPEMILSCSYCGSVHPDYFMEKIHEGWYVGPTDKSYKAYLGRPFSPTELAVHRHEWLAGHIANIMRDSGSTEDEIVAQYEREHAPLHTSRDVGKFYYQHLSVQQRVDFIELHNAGLMKIGYPGHFYTPPFFCDMT